MEEVPEPSPDDQTSALIAQLLAEDNPYGADAYGDDSGQDSDYDRPKRKKTPKAGERQKWCMLGFAREAHFCLTIFSSIASGSIKLNGNASGTSKGGVKKKGAAKAATTAAASASAQPMTNVQAANAEAPPGAAGQSACENGQQAAGADVAAAEYTETGRKRRRDTGTTAPSPSAIAASTICKFDCKKSLLCGSAAFQ